MNRIPLSEVCDYSNVSTSVSSLTLDTFISTDNMMPNRGGIVEAVNLPPANSCPKFEKDNILLSNIRPYFKKIWFATFEGGCSTDVLVLKCKNEKYNPKYVYYNLFQDLFFKHMMNGAKGSKMPRGDKDQVMTFLISEYPEQYQKQVANYLSLLDDKIFLNNKIIAELEQMSNNIYKYWFVQFDFPNETGNPYKNSGGEMEFNIESGREIPVGWLVKKIDEVAAVKAGGDKPEIFSLFKTEQCSIPIYSNGIDNEGLYGYTQEASIKRQSITVSARGTIGYCVLRNAPFVPIIRLIVVTPNITHSSKYFHEYLKSVEYIKNGSVQQQLTAPEISSFKIIIPKSEVLEKFDKITSNYTEKIELIKIETQALISLRDFLLPLLLNGQVKVK